MQEVGAGLLLDRIRRAPAWISAWQQRYQLVPALSLFSHGERALLCRRVACAGFRPGCGRPDQGWRTLLGEIRGLAFTSLFLLAFRQRGNRNGDGPLSALDRIIPVSLDPGTDLHRYRQEVCGFPRALCRPGGVR